MDDFQSGFAAARLGAEAFLDKKFREDLVVLFKREYKMELAPKELGPLLNLVLSFNLALHDLYLNKTMQILSLPKGTVLEVCPQEEKAKEKEKKTKRKRKPKIIPLK